MPDTAKAALAGDDLGFQHRPRAIAEQQVGVTDDAGADQSGTVAAAGAHRRDTVGEFDFADRAERLRPVGAIHRTAVDIDGADDVVTGGDIGRHFLDHVAQAAAIPQMMVRIDNRARGIDDFLGVLRKPVFARIGIESAFGRGGSTGGHGSLLPEIVALLSGDFHRLPAQPRAAILLISSVERDEPSCFFRKLNTSEIWPAGRAALTSIRPSRSLLMTILSPG